MKKLAGTGSVPYILAGDFNISAREQHEHQPFAGYAETMVDITQYGCDGCAGTHKFGSRWSWLDKIVTKSSMIVEGGASSSVAVDVTSLRVINDAPEQVTKSGNPRRFSLHSGKGASDHLPVAVQILVP